MNARLILVVSAALAGLGAIHTDQSPPMAGRYQLFNARYDVVGGPREMIATELFRIDTVTGKTWQYKAGKIANDAFFNWEETFEAEDMKELKKLKQQRQQK